LVLVSSSTEVRLSFNQQTVVFDITLSLPIWITSGVQVLYVVCRYYTELGCYDSLVGNSWVSYDAGICSVYIMCPVDNDLWHNLFTPGL